MTKELFVDEQNLKLNDPPRLVWIRARDAIGLLWRENPKLHDLQSLVNSVRRHAFQVPAKFDSCLFRTGQPPGDEEPLGAIKAGNGRIEAVAWLEAHWEDVKADEEGIPRGLAVDGEGAWFIPVLIGTDAKSTSAAMEFAIDDNNSVMMGGDLDGFDMARLWDAHYVSLVAGLDELPVTVDGDVLAALGSMFDPPNLDDLLDEHGEPDPEDFWPVVRVKVSPETHELYESLMSQAPGGEDSAKFAALMSAVDVAILGTVVS